MTDKAKYIGVDLAHAGDEKIVVTVPLEMYQDALRELKACVDALGPLVTIDEEYQADKADGPFDMVYRKWIVQREIRKENAKAALTRATRFLEGK